MTDDLDAYESTSGRLEPVWTVEIQTVAADVDRILDAICAEHALPYGRYERNASVTAAGLETARPLPDSTTHAHGDGFEIGDTETYPMVVVMVSVPRDLDVLRRVMDGVLHVHHYEEPVVFVREAWASRSAYDPDSTNPNRWWNDGRGMPGRIDDITTYLTQPTLTHPTGRGPS